MTTPLRLRKFSPIDREYPIFEVMYGDQVLFDIGRTDEGTYELAFHESCSGKVLLLEEAWQLIEEAKNQLATDPDPRDPDQG